jgi:3-isopropylmalate dehydrogenase
MAQAAHGSAPDIAGRDLANPISLILSTALLLAWHGERSGETRFQSAAHAIENAIAIAMQRGRVTKDVGGSLGTEATAQAIARILRSDLGTSLATASDEANVPPERM